MTLGQDLEPRVIKIKLPCLAWLPLSNKLQS